MAANAVHHPFAAIGNAGDVFEIADGIRWVRMPLPFALNHINLWLLRDGEGWTVVDTGIARPEVQAHWRRVLEEVGEGRAGPPHHRDPFPPRPPRQTPAGSRRRTGPISGSPTRSG